MAFWKAYFTGDIHGSEATFRKLTRAGKFYSVQAVILAGDLVGKGMVPIVKMDNRYYVEMGGETRVAETEAEAAKLESMINDEGFYSYRTDREEVLKLRADPQRTNQVVEKLITDRLQRWLSILEDSSTKDGITYYVSPGNDDPSAIDPVLDASSTVINPEYRLVHVHDKIDMITCGWTNPTPWDTERELPEDQLYDKLNTLAQQVPDPSRCIFSLHAPPYGTKLDLGPRLDKDLRMQGGFGKDPFAHVGSTAVRKIIEQYQPLVSVHGHIHESAGRDKIGKTECYNPGSEYAQGVLRGLILTFNIDKQAKLASYLSVSG
jgi:hypothetical protein